MGFTPSNLYNQIRAECNEAGVGYLTENELYNNMWIAETELALYTKCTETKATAITTVTGTKEYAKPTGCMVIERCQWDSVKLKKIDLTELDQVEGVAYGGVSVTGSPVYYYEYGSNIGISPTPVSNKNIDIWMVKEPAQLSTASSGFTIPSEYTRYLSDYCLYRFHLKDDNPAMADRYLNVWENNKKKCKSDWMSKKFMDKYPKVKDEEQFQGTDEGII